MKKIIIFAALCLSFQTACDKEDLGGRIYMYRSSIIMR